MKRDKRVLCCGYFNVFHAGHVELLEYAARLGTVWVGLNTDPANIRKNGEYAVPLINRIKVLSSCKYVSKVVVFGEETPAELIRRLKPTYFIKGPDYVTQVLPEELACDEVGTYVVIHQANKIQDSSKLVGGLDPRVFKLDSWD